MYIICGLGYCGIQGVLPILSGGLNERFSGGLFGNGTYLAEERLLPCCRT